MKLFVDDIRQPPEGWEIARTNTDAIRVLATGYVEEISLDHDISEERPGGFVVGAETFMPVAYYLALMPNRPKIVFHTGNFAMGERMAEIIGCKFEHTMWENVNA